MADLLKRRAECARAVAHARAYADGRPTLAEVTGIVERVCADRQHWYLHMEGEVGVEQLARHCNERSQRLAALCERLSSTDDVADKEELRGIVTEACRGPLDDRRHELDLQAGRLNAIADALAARVDCAAIESSGSVPMDADGNSNSSDSTTEAQRRERYANAAQRTERALAELREAAAAEVRAAADHVGPLCASASRALARTLSPLMTDALRSDADGGWRRLCSGIGAAQTDVATDIGMHARVERSVAAAERRIDARHGASIAARAHHRRRTLAVAHLREDQRWAELVAATGVPAAVLRAHWRRALEVAPIDSPAAVADDQAGDGYDYHRNIGVFIGEALCRLVNAGGGWHLHVSREMHLPDMAVVSAGNSVGEAIVVAPLRASLLEGATMDGVPTSRTMLTRSTDVAAMRWLAIEPVLRPANERAGRPLLLPLRTVVMGNVLREDPRLLPWLAFDVRQVNHDRKLARVRPREAADEPTPLAWAVSVLWRLRAALDVLYDAGVRLVPDGDSDTIEAVTGADGQAYVFVRYWDEVQVRAHARPRPPCHHHQTSTTPRSSANPARTTATPKSGWAG